MEELLKVNNLTKRYGKTLAVDNASFTIEKGKIYGLLGPNGAGKTTIMKLLTNMIQKTGGTIYCKKDLNVKYLMDVPQFYEYMTVKEFLLFLIDINKIENKDERLDYLLSLTSLNEHKDKKIKSLSRGLRQKLGIASVLVSDIDVLILDEPISALDPIGRKEIMDIIVSLKGKVTIIFSSHILNDIEKVCDHFLLINKGKIVLNESCENVLAPVNHLLVKTLNREEILQLKQVYSEALFSKRYENTLEISYEDLLKTQTEVLKYAKKLNVTIVKMEVKLQSLEDMFLEKVMNNE